MSHTALKTEGSKAGRKVQRKRELQWHLCHAELEEGRANTAAAVTEDGVGGRGSSESTCDTCPGSTGNGPGKEMNYFLRGLSFMLYSREAANAM